MPDADADAGADETPKPATNKVAFILSVAGAIPCAVTRADKRANEVPDTGPNGIPDGEPLDIALLFPFLESIVKPVIVAE